MTTKVEKIATIEQLCGEKSIQPIRWPKGTHPDYKSEVWQFKREGRHIAQFTSLDRIIQWLEGFCFGTVISYGTKGWALLESNQPKANYAIAAYTARPNAPVLVALWRGFLAQLMEAERDRYPYSTILFRSRLYRPFVLCQSALPPKVHQSQSCHISWQSCKLGFFQRR